MVEEIRLEQRVSEAVAEDAKLRRKAAIWTAAFTAAVAGTLFCWWAAVWAASNAAALVALLASGAVAATGTASYWAWRRVQRMDGRIVAIVSAFAERAVEARRPESEARQADAQGGT